MHFTYGGDQLHDPACIGFDLAQSFLDLIDRPQHVDGGVEFLVEVSLALAHQLKVLILSSILFGKDGVGLLEALVSFPMDYVRTCERKVACCRYWEMSLEVVD